MVHCNNIFSNVRNTSKSSKYQIEACAPMSIKPTQAQDSGCSVVLSPSVSMSSFAIIFLLLGLHLVHIPLSVFSNSTKPLRADIAHICHSTSPFPILGIGITKERFLLVTDTLKVYDFPQSLMLGEHRLMLPDADKPLPLCSKWSIVCSKVTSDSIKQLVHFFTSSFETANYLLMFTDSGDSVNNAILETDKGKIFLGIHYQSSGGKQVSWISSDASSNTTYQVVHSANGTLTMNQISVPPLGNGQVYLMVSGLYRHLCTVAHSKPPAVFIKYGACDQSNGEVAVKWPVLCGFIAEGNFYLLGADGHVYIFPQWLFTRTGISAPLTILTVQHFFGCSAETDGSDGIDSTGKDSRHAHAKHKKAHGQTDKGGHHGVVIGLTVGVLILSIVGMSICCILLLGKTPPPPVRPRRGSRRKPSKESDHQNELADEKWQKEEQGGASMSGQKVASKGKTAAGGKRRTSKSRKSKTRSLRTRRSRPKQTNAESRSNSRQQTAVSSRRNQAPRQGRSGSRSSRRNRS